MKREIACTCFYLFFLGITIASAAPLPRSVPFQPEEWKSHIRDIFREYAFYLPEYQNQLDFVNVEFTDHAYPKLKIAFVSTGHAYFGRDSKGLIVKIHASRSFLDLVESDLELRIALLHELGHIFSNHVLCDVTRNSDGVVVLKENGYVVFTNTRRCKESMTKEHEADIFAVRIFEMHHPGHNAARILIILLRRVVEYPYDGDTCGSCPTRAAWLSEKYGIEE